jgi:hypothetical protein
MASKPAAPSPEAGLNPRLNRRVDHEFSEAQHGSEPMETVSVKHNGPAVWPVIWAVVTIGMVLLALWLFFG